MANDRERTACCGLYCGDCIPANDSLFETAAKLRQLLEDTQFAEYARYKSIGNKTFGSYGTFTEVLGAILALRCPRTCPNGGGRPDCPIRGCARRKGMEGCWQCAVFETCELLEPLCACHGDTHRHNLRIVKQYGVENWSHKRGTHYIWPKSQG
ncbi:MAG: DUF3795 domain-containing protein [Solirubrobacterales bacterium]